MPGLNMSPTQVFLGRSGWKHHSLVEEVDGIPRFRDWLEHVVGQNEKARRRLQEIRAKALQRRNRGRKEASYKVDDWVLVHPKRFPQRKMKGLGIQWYGPYRVVHGGAHSVRVRASPTLGGEVVVHHSFLKRWPGGTVLDDDLDGEEVGEELQDEEKEDGG